jgi:hypothetical protein
MYAKIFPLPTAAKRRTGGSVQSGALTSPAVTGRQRVKWTGLRHLGWDRSEWLRPRGSAAVLERENDENI